MLDSRSEGAGCSEDVAQLEVQLPPRGRPPEDVRLVEPVRDVDAERPERRHHRCTESCPAEQPRRIVLPGAAIHVPRVEKGIDVERPADPRPGLDRKRRERLAERVHARLPAARAGIVPVRRDRELAVTPEGSPELYAA